MLPVVKNEFYFALETFLNGVELKFYYYYICHVFGWYYYSTSSHLHRVNCVASSQPTGEVVQNRTSPQQDVISEQRKRDPDSTEDMSPETQNAEKKHQMTNMPQSIEKKPRKMKNAPQRALVKQLKQMAAKTKATEDGKKALEELEESVNWTNDETRITPGS
ncbi:hypothetical protein P692DRAFT_20819965 [Suillus brevipes Sb2]|nr:hypothetical protein P692DRAFT_20819965 [Suillus brevipes Sb2]